MPPPHSTGIPTALYRVLVLPTLSHAHPSAHLPCPPFSHLRRSFTSTPQSLAKVRAPEVRRQKWDAQITSPYIYLLDPVTNSRPDQPVRTAAVLRSYDTTTHRLVQFSDEAHNEIPVCKLLSKKEMHDASQRHREAQKTRKLERGHADSTKTLELNWAIESKDLAHRLEKVTDFLREGRRVEIVLAKKKRGRQATPQECEEVLKKIKDTAESVPGAKEARAMEGKPGGFATLVLVGKMQLAREQKQDAGAVATT